MTPTEINELARSMYDTDPHARGITFEDAPEGLKAEYVKKADKMQKSMEKRGYSVQELTKYDE